MKTAEKVISGIVHMVTKAEAAPWPPFCIGIMYQPERPVAPRKGDMESSPARRTNDFSVKKDTF